VLLILAHHAITIVTIANYPRVEEICDSIAPPKKQFERNRRLYPNEPLRRCQEWTVEAIQALTQAGVLQTQASSVQEGEGMDYWSWDESRTEWYHDNGDGTFAVKVQQENQSKDWSWDEQKSRWYFNDGNGICTVKYN